MSLVSLAISSIVFHIVFSHGKHSFQFMRCVSDGITRKIQEMTGLVLIKGLLSMGLLHIIKAITTEKLHADDIVIHTLINWQNIKN